MSVHSLRPSAGEEHYGARSFPESGQRRKHHEYGNGLSADRDCVQSRPVHGDLLRTYAAGHRQLCSVHDRAAVRRPDEYRAGPNHDLRLFRFPPHGRFRCCSRHRHRSVCLGHCRVLLEPVEESGAPPETPGFQSEPRGSVRYLCRRPAQLHHGVHRFSHECRYECHPFRLCRK